LQIFGGNRCVERLLIFTVLTLAEVFDEDYALFQGSIAGTLADTIDAAFNLPGRSLKNSVAGVLHGKTKVVVAGNRPDDLVVGKFLFQDLGMMGHLSDEIFFSLKARRPTDGVRAIDHRRTS